MSATLEHTAILPVTFDLYRDIHKGIRAELFAVTAEAGHLDPASHAARATLADKVRTVRDTLISHAEHEDSAIAPAITAHLPHVAERVEVEHASLERRLDQLRTLADLVVDADRRDQRAGVHQLYLDLASFTSAYLAHQDLEERIIMPALEAAIGVDAVVTIHMAIIGSIPPPQMASSLAFMLPAMNLEDRCELLGGMREAAPPEVFAGVWGLAKSSLSKGDALALGGRLGITAD